jgi:hypothetical protein
MKKPPGCKKHTVKIKRKSGKVVATFVARSGKGCKPRTEAQRKHATRKQSEQRKHFAKSAAACRRAGIEPFTKKFGNCMATRTIREL